MKKHSNRANKFAISAYTFHKYHSGYEYHEEKVFGVFVYNIQQNIQQGTYLFITGDIVICIVRYYLCYMLFLDGYPIQEFKGIIFR